MEKKLKIYKKRAGAVILASALLFTTIPSGMLHTEAAVAGQGDREATAYFVDCGDYVVNTVCDGDELGTRNSVTDQVYGEDSVTGYRWGIVDTVSDPLKNGSSNKGGVYTDNTWAYEFNTEAQDVSSKTGSNRYTKNQYENGIETRYLDYKFELEAGTYMVETYMADPWNCSKSPSLLLDTESKTAEEISKDFNSGKGQVLSPGAAYSEQVTLEQDGDLTVGFRAKGDANKAINVCYIKITDVSKINPETYIDQDMQSIYFGFHDLTKNLNLPLAGPSGCDITWSSSNKQVLSDQGVVTRPGSGEADVPVELTATVSYNGLLQKSKVFSFTVCAESTLEDLNHFDLEKVAVTDAYYKAAQDSDIAFLKKFDNDRLLSRFRETAGLDTKGIPPYNGWENSYIGGHSVGHYLTACAQAIKATGDEELKAKLAVIVDELKKCQDNLGTGFIFGAQIQDPNNVEKQFNIVEGKDQGNTWVPWYTMHKIMAGLLDLYKFADDPDALEVAKNLGTWIYNRVSKWDNATQQTISWTEYGGMNDCMYELYKLTGDTRYRDAAHRFDDPKLYQEILSGKPNTLNQRHANATIPKFVGALNRYIALKQVETNVSPEDEKYLEYAEGFWSLVVEKHAFITGGVSDMEHFKADNSLDAVRTQCNCESCCAHNMLKLSRELFKITGEKKYADYYENTMRNAIMGAVNTADGSATYFTPMATGYYKVFGDPDPAKNQFWCCTGSGMENYTKLGDSIYFYGEDALVVNQYVDSRVTWDEKQIQVVQKSDVTRSETAEFDINMLNQASDVKMKLYLRVPDWIAGAPALTINGADTDFTVSGGYICVDRTWKQGDKAVLTYPMKVTAYGLPDNSTVYGFKYGPTVLAAKLGREQWNDRTWAGANLTAPAYKVVGNEQARLNVSYGQTTRQILGTETLLIKNGKSIKEFMDQADLYFEKTGTDGELSFKITGTDADNVFSDGLTFVPFNTLNDERYGIYWYFQAGDEGTSEDKILSEKEEGRFAASLLDSIQPGYPQYENDDIHQMEEKDTEFGNLEGIGSTRYAKPGGHFSYNMVVKKGQKNSLLCQFVKEDNGKTIKITVGDTVIAEETLSYDGDDNPYRVYYEIPEAEVNKAKEITIGDETHSVVRVRFESNKQDQESARLAGGLYTARPYSSNAQITEITSNQGEISKDGDNFILEIPTGINLAELDFTLADKMGLLYMDNVLINDTKTQTVRLSGDYTTIALKAYGEDHTTFKEYSLNIVRGGVAKGEEIIKNPGFEDGTTNWEGYDSASLELGYTTLYAGARSLKVVNRTKTSSGPCQDITGKLKPGKTYKVSGAIIFKEGEAYNPNPPKEAVFHMSIFYGDRYVDGSSIQNMATQKISLGDWGIIEGTYTVPQDADLSKVRVFFETDYRATPTEQDLISFFLDEVSMKEVDPQEEDEDQKAAEAVQAKIGAIGTVVYTEECKARIEEARKAYDLLTGVQKGLVNNYGTLTAAEETYQKLKEEAESSASDLEEAIKKAQEAQAAAEKASKEAEQAQKEAEAAKQEAQNARDEADTALSEAKKAQQDAEAAKTEAEKAERQAEEARQQAEEARQQAGADSEAAKEAKAKAEAMAAEAEAARKAAEDSQKAADKAAEQASKWADEADKMMQRAETAQKAAVAAELQATALKEQAKADRLAAEAAAQKAEQDRLEAEQNRQKAEQDKAEAEQNLREAQEAQKKAQELESMIQEAKRKAQEAQRAAEKAREDIKPVAEKPDASVEVAVKKTTLKSAKSPKKGQIKIAWSKVSKASGYEIKYGVNKKFRNAKTKRMGSSKTSYTVKRLKSKKTYYVRLRAYKLVDGKRVYGPYSKSRKVRAK